MRAVPLPPFRRKIRRAFAAALRDLSYSPDDEVLGAIVIVWNREQEQPVLYRAGLNVTESIGLLERGKYLLQVSEGTILLPKKSP